MLRTSTIDNPSSPVTFSVDEVKPATMPIWTETQSLHLARRFKRKVMFVAEGEKLVTNAYRGSLEQRDMRKISPDLLDKMRNSLVNRGHPLIDAVGTAFSQHYPLTLSPDCIWLVIEQGFAHHVTENAESLHHRLVRHEGKVKLNACVSALSQADFEHAVSSFSSKIREATDPVLHETLLCDFSTTTSVTRTASEVVLLDCYASYFEYMMTCVCGIPKITLTGSVEDWQRIRARIEILETFGLDWWVSRLRPILDEFIKTAQGHPSLAFWKAIYKPRKTYGTESVTGWIADLFPYLNDPPNRRRSNIFNHPREDWSIPVEDGVVTKQELVPQPNKMAVSLKSFPSGLSSVPIGLSLPDQSFLELDLVAGFFAVEQDAESLALSPAIGWCVAEHAPLVSVFV